MSTVQRATAIGAISIGLWGTLALLTSLTEGRIPPFQLLAMTFSVAFGVMLLHWWRQGSSGLQYLRQPLLAWVLGIGGLFGYHFLYFLALANAPVAEANLLNYLWPLLIVVFASFLPNERLRVNQVVGSLIAIAGCWLLVGGGTEGFKTQYLMGYLAAIGAAVIWATYSVASRLVKQVPTDAVGWFCGVTALLGWLCHFGWEPTVWPSNAMQWFSVLGAGLGPVGIAFFTWDYGVKHGNLPLLGVLSYFTPLISTLLLIVFGQAAFTWQVGAACGAIILGAWVASYKSKAK